MPTEINSTPPPEPLFVNQSMIVHGSVHAFDFVQYSDERLKSDIQRINNALQLVSQLRGSKYVWRHNGRKAYGLIAQGELFGPKHTLEHRH